MRMLDVTNEPCKPLMEEGNSEIAGAKGDAKCESVVESGESNSSFGGTVRQEGEPVATEAGEEGSLDNDGAAAGVSEFTAELVGDEVVAEGGVSEKAAPKNEDPSLQLKVEEETERVDEAKGDAIATDMDGPVIAESQVGIAEGVVEPQLDGKVGEEFSPIADAKLEIDAAGVSDEPLVDAAEDEAVDQPKEIKAKEESAPVVDSKVDVVVSDGQVSCDLKMDAEGNKMEEVDGGMEPFKKNVEMDAGVGSNVEAILESAEVDDEKISVVANDSDAGIPVKFVGSVEENSDPVITSEANDSDVGIPVKLVGSVEENSDPVITNEETVLLDAKSNAYIITEDYACPASFNEEDHVHELDGGRKLVDSSVKSEHVEGEKLAQVENLMPGTQKVEDEKLDDPVNMSASLGNAVVKEENSVGAINTEIRSGKELELTENAMMEENKLTDAEAETEIVTKDVADKTSEEDSAMQTEMVTKAVTDKTPEEDSAMQTETGIIDDSGKLGTEETASDVDEPGQENYDSTAGIPDEEDETMVAEEDTGTQDTAMETENDITDSGKTSGGKRKRGNVSKSGPVSKAAAKSSSRKTVGEDVCFICFDGGELVLCDRRGCPKAYHPSCVNRDEAFFKSKGRWNCGWHLCSICEKNARYMCYTCAYSLCKSCTKEAVILCVRGNKGFCETCMRMVTLIEKSEQGNKDIQVDFDDKSSWEYLFKDYYTDLKAKLSLTSDEIAEAKNPWKGADMSGPGKHESPKEEVDANDGGSGSDYSVENVEPAKPKRRKIRKQPKAINKEDEVVRSCATGDKAVSLSDNPGWASKDLLEFVSHMKNGDTSILSQFDVQALLLEYIKKNKLRDPRRKSQIICDPRLENLFGKARVAHFEMLKLLESHFLIKDEQNDDVQGSVVDTENNQLDVDGNADFLTKGVKDRKRKSRKKGGSRGPQSNLDDYAAIDMHNIGLIYLRRKLMEDLLEEAETFHDKVVGTFVRIRISGSTQKQDLYRLVQVVGTSKAAEPYKIGKKTTNTTVEILNLDKTEIISIDTISNQEFSEEECKRLRQSIKCGLISRLTVGEILDKTMELQTARVNDWLESETLRLAHLRDRASDLGRRKELRECVEKLQLLKTPEERQRRLDEIPDIHTDPKMDPSYESDDDDSEPEDSRQDTFLRPRGSGYSRRERGSIITGTNNSVKDSWSGATKVPNKSWEPSRNLSGSNFSTNAGHIGDISNDKSCNSERERVMKETNHLGKLNSSNLDSAERALRTTRTESFSGVASATSQASLLVGIAETAVKINESEKMWHYKDPSGKVQGPFSMVQLRKWNNTGYFPADLKIWRSSENQGNSILLADALAGKFPKEAPAIDDAISIVSIMQSSNTVAEHSGRSLGTSLHHNKERPNAEQKSGSHSTLSAENWRRTDITNLPSPTPKQSSAGLTGIEGGIPSGAVQSPSINGVLPSPTSVSPNIITQSPAPASLLTSVLQNVAAFSPTPNSQLGNLVGSAVTLPTQSATSSDPHSVKMHGHPPATAQPVQTPTGQNLQAETQNWGSGATLSGQPQGYGWNPSNVQNSAGSFPNSGTPAGLQPDVWRPPQGNLPNIPTPAAPTVSWGMGPPDNNAPVTVRPDNPNIAWGPNPMQASPNMGWGNPTTGNANMNWGPGMPAPPPGNPAGWVAPAGNAGANIQGMVPGNANPNWAATQGWSAVPPQVPMPGNGWGGQPPLVQGPPPQGNTNQGWAAPTGNQGGSWRGDQGQFMGQRGSQGQDPSLGGGGPWNRQASFGGGGRGDRVGGGSRRFVKRDTICPYNTNGRCRKGSYCDYIHT